MEIGRQVKLLRMGGGKSQKAVAEAAGLQPSQLSRIESGNHDFKVSTLVPVLKVLGAEMNVALRKERAIDSAQISDDDEAQRKETAGVA